jgi:XRE family transcriptional regulator, regulator of sulfur utilization
MSDAVRLRLGENLIRYRTEAGLSQEELSFRASLHRTEVGMLERGARLPRIDTLLKLMGALEVSADELLEGMSWVPGEPVQGGFSYRSARLEIKACGS